MNNVKQQIILAKQAVTTYKAGLKNGVRLIGLLYALYSFFSLSTSALISSIISLLTISFLPFIFVEKT